MNDDSAPSPPPPPGPGVDSPTFQPPPLNLPKPDGFGDINQQSRVNREKDRAEKKRRKEKERARRHPTDPYEPLDRRGRGGCIGCLLLLAVLAVLPLVAAYSWIASAEAGFLREHYTRSAVPGGVVEAAPEKKMLYESWLGAYKARETPVEIAFIGGEWRIGGTFHKKVSFRGARLILEPGTVFHGDLDVVGAIFDAGDAKIDGELTGRVMRQTGGAARK